MEFKDLNSKVKEKLIREYIVDVDIDYGGWMDDWKYQLENLGFYGVRIYFSFNYCQGDGACFTFKEIDVPKWLRSMGLGKEYDPLIEQIDEYGISYKIYHSDHHYYHSNSHVITEISMGYIEDELYPLFLKLKDIMNDEYHELCRKLETSGWKETEYIQSEQFLAERYEGIEFDENGEQI